MFMLPRNPFDEWPKWWTMTDAPLTGSTRRTGAMEPLCTAAGTSNSGRPIASAHPTRLRVPRAADWSPASPVLHMPLSESHAVGFGPLSHHQPGTIEWARHELRCADGGDVDMSTLVDLLSDGAEIRSPTGMTPGCTPLAPLFPGPAGGAWLTPFPAPGCANGCR